MISASKILIGSILFLVVILTAINVKMMSGMDADSVRILQESNPVVPFVHPFTKVYHRLEEFNWDAAAIDEALREHWSTTMSVLKHKIDDHGANVTTLSTSCRHTSPWILGTLFDLPVLPAVQHTFYLRPLNTDLLVYDNTQYPRSYLPKPPVEKMINFIGSRPSSESILFQIDLCQQVSPTYAYLDHHFMVHAYDGQICLYHGWQWRFNLIDWMTDEGSFGSRYPMDQDIFFEHFERMLAPAETEEEIRAREVAIWSIFGRTKTQTWKEGENEGELRLDDIVVRELTGIWLPTQIHHWPHSIEPVNFSFRPINSI